MPSGGWICEDIIITLWYYQLEGAQKKNYNKLWTFKIKRQIMPLDMWLGLKEKLEAQARGSPCLEENI